MKLVLVLMIFGVFLSGCGGTAAVKSKQEARIHAVEKKRFGLMTNERYSEEVKKIVSSNLPEKPDSPIDIGEIRNQYANKAKGNKAAYMTNAYNTGRLSKAKYGQYMATMRQKKYATIALAVASGLAGVGASPNYSGSTGYGSKSGYKYDPKTGNSYNYSTDSQGTTTVRGSNLGTGSNWTNIIDKKGNQRGIDSNFNNWTYNAATGNYYNYGTGKSCYGKGSLRQCY